MTDVPWTVKPGSKASKPPRPSDRVIGLLALQGDFALHAESFLRLGIKSREVRTPEQLSGVDGLVLPGGESTAMLKLMEGTGLGQALVDYVVAGGAVFATCAGLILLARTVRQPEQRSLGIMDIDVLRNDYGRQIDSFETQLEWVGDKTPLSGVFIRAPRVNRMGPLVSVLARFDGSPVLIREDRILAASFHPELTTDTRLHRYFLEEIVGSALGARLAG